MENKIINGTELSKSIKNDLKIKIDDIKNKYNTVPCLAVILVGDNPASQVYVKNKEKACEKCGIKSLKYNLSENITEEELVDLIDKLNKIVFI